MENYSEMQKKIVAASVNIMAVEGFYNLTIKNIARRIGVTDGAIYKHFESKDDILLGIISYFKALFESYIRFVKSSSKPAFELLHDLILEKCTRIAKNPDLLSQVHFLYDMKGEAEFVFRIKTFLDDYRDIVVELIQTSQHEGKLRKDVSANYIYFTIEGTVDRVITKWDVSKRSFDLVTEIENLWIYLIKICG